MIPKYISTRKEIEYVMCNRDAFFGTILLRIVMIVKIMKDYLRIMQRSITYIHNCIHFKKEDRGVTDQTRSIINRAIVHNL